MSRYGSHGEEKIPRNHFKLEPSPPARILPRNHDAWQTTAPSRGSEPSESCLCGAVELSIQAVTPVHVGNGSYVLHEGEIRKAPMERKGRLIVPGSSIKGMCRLTHESLFGGKNPFSKRITENDPSGALFGVLGYQGRVSFDDAFGTETLRPQRALFSVPYSHAKGSQRSEQVSRRFYGTMPEDAEQTRQIKALAIPAKSELQTILRFQSVTFGELGTILLALGVERFNTRLGGAKYDHYGWVRFSAGRHRLRRGLGRPGEWSDDPKANRRFVDRALADAEKLLDGGRVNYLALQSEMKPGRKDLNP